MNPKDRYDSLLAFYARGVSPEHAKRQLLAESNMNPRAVSAVGARGLAQFMMETWTEYGSSDFDDAFNPELSIEAYFRYMEWLLGRWKTTSNPLRLAVASYNWGIGNLRKAYLRYGDHRWEDALPKETKGYLHRVFQSPIAELT